MTVYLANLIFFLSPKDLEARLGATPLTHAARACTVIVGRPQVQLRCRPCFWRSQRSSSVLAQNTCAAAGAVVALFLALAAIQFVVAANMPASSYITALGHLILASYIILFLVGVESLGVFKLAIYCERKRRYAQDLESPASPISLFHTR